MKPSINEVTVYFLAFLSCHKTEDFNFSSQHFSTCSVWLFHPTPSPNPLAAGPARHHEWLAHLQNKRCISIKSSVWISILLLLVGTRNPSAISTSKYSQVWPNVRQHWDILLACHAKWRWCWRCLISLQRSFGGIQRKHWGTLRYLDLHIVSWHRWSLMYITEHV